MLELFAERGLIVLLATSIPLVLAAVLVAASRRPLHRERTAELGIVGAALVFILMFVPMPGPVGQLTMPASRSPTGVAYAVPESRRPAVTVGHESKYVPMARHVPSQDSAMGSRKAVAIAFVCASLAMLALFAGSLLALARLARHGRPLPVWLSARLPTTPRHVQVLLCDRSLRPVCFRLRRIYILLPSHLAQPGNAAMLHSVVEHELAHVQLGHAHWRQVIAACSVVLFPHPVYWWLTARQREAAELLADEAASLRVGKKSYVEHLIELVEQLRARQAKRVSSPLSTLSVLSVRDKVDGHFSLRMRTLLMRSKMLRSRFTPLQFATRAIAFGGLLGVITLALGRPIFAEDAGSPGLAAAPENPLERVQVRRDVWKKILLVHERAKDQAGMEHADFALEALQGSGVSSGSTPELLPGTSGRRLIDSVKRAARGLVESGDSVSAVACSALATYYTARCQKSPLALDRLDHKTASGRRSLLRRAWLDRDDMREHPATSLVRAIYQMEYDAVRLEERGRRAVEPTPSRLRLVASPLRAASILAATEKPAIGRALARLASFYWNRADELEERAVLRERLQADIDRFEAELAALTQRPKTAKTTRRIAELNQQLEALRAAFR